LQAEAGPDNVGREAGVNHEARSEGELSATEIGALAAEAASALYRRRLDKVAAIDERTLALWFGERALLLSLSPGLAWLFVTERRRPAPERPPAFVMKLRAEIGGLFLSRIWAPQFERAVEIVFGAGPDRPERTLAAEFFGRAPRLLLLDEKREILYSAIGRAEPGVPYRLPDSPVPRSAGGKRFPPPDPESLACSRAAEEAYLRLVGERRLAARRARVLKEIANETQRCRRRLDRLRADRERAQSGAKLIREGELLKANLRSIPPGVAEVRLVDPAAPDGGMIQVRLDPARTVVENMQRMFSRGKRLLAALSAIERRVKDCEESLSALEEKRSRAEKAQALADLAAFSPAETTFRKTPASLRSERLPYREYRSSAGKSILVGRSARDNDRLTFGHARGEDLWLHVRGGSGSHVVVRLDRGETVDESTLREAALLAAANSSLSKSDKVEVGYTKVKNVHKAPKSPPGTVSVAKLKTILIKIDGDNLARIKEKIINNR
jgi:predicted ribosome quality control (RQC) complex YloA/Tae2 family protein